MPVDAPVLSVVRKVSIVRRLGRGRCGMFDRILECAMGSGWLIAGPGVGEGTHSGVLCMGWVSERGVRWQKLQVLKTGGDDRERLIRIC